jgi:hypothetical protein
MAVKIRILFFLVDTNIYEEHGASNFWDVTPCSPLKVNRRFRAVLDTRFTLVSCLALKMGMTYSSETLVHFQRTWRCLPEDRMM